MNKRNFINGYYLLQEDLKEVLLFIEPVDHNYKTHSHKLYSLLIRACIEFEAHCKKVLIENRLGKSGDLNICDFYEISTIEPFKKMFECKIKLNVSEEIIFTPLSQWKKDNGPSWYRAYNDVKHSRIDKFRNANLENVLHAISAVYVLLILHFGTSAMKKDQECTMTIKDNEFISADTSLFQLSIPIERE